MKQDIAINIGYTCIIMFWLTSNTLAQNPINVIQSNQLSQININDTLFQKFSGDVIIEYADLEIICDTILINQHKNLMLGWGSVSISNDTISCITDSIKIKEVEKKIILYQNSYLHVHDMHIYSNYMEYNYRNNILEYFSGGLIENKEDKITSTNFSYNLEAKISEFSDNVNIITNDKYRIKTESMHYNDSLMRFSGNTNINHIDFNVISNKGILKPSHFLKLTEGIVLNFEDRIITADILERDLINNKNYFSNNIHIKFDKNTSAKGNNLIQFNNLSTITENCQIELKNKTDSIIIKGDIIKMYEKTDEVEIVDNIVIRGKQLNGNCGMITFTSNYKKINMSINPVLWLNSIQVTGKEITLYQEKNEIDSIYIPIQPFIISPYRKTDYYNQITGNRLEGKLKHSSVDYIEINGNSKMKYFEINSKNDSILTINNVESSKIKINFKEEEINKILCSNQIESNQIEFSTNKKIEQELLYLKGFKLMKMTFLEKK